MDENAYLQGKRATALVVLRAILSDLDIEDRTLASAQMERAEAVTALRRICSLHGDNDWPDELHLADVIEKHLGRHLSE